MESTFLDLDNFIKVVSKMVWGKVKENSAIRMEEFMKEDGYKEPKEDLEPWFFPTAPDFSDFSAKAS